MVVVSIMTTCVMFAQGKQVTIKAGTPVPLKITNPVKAADLNEGSQVSFKVARDIMIDGITAIPYGTIAKGKVYKAKKSSVFGVPGKLGINITDIILPNGTNIPLDGGNIYVKGTNRVWCGVVSLLIFWPTVFVCGGKAELPANYEIEPTVANNVVTTIE